MLVVKSSCIGRHLNKHLRAMTNGGFDLCVTCRKLLEEGPSADVVCSTQQEIVEHDEPDAERISY